MKTKSRIALALILASATATYAMDDDGWATTYESLSAFDSSIPIYGNRPDYVKPIITNLGTILNSNWVSSAGVPKSFTFEAGLPFAIVPITDDDRSYTTSIDILGQRISYETPTIFGEHGNVQQPDNRIYGNENLNSLGVFTYPYLQLAGSFYHARLVLRGMFLPSISQLQKFNLFGFGLQYSFGHFFQYKLPKAAQPLDVSLMFGYSTSGIGYQPDDYNGELDLDISAYTINLVVGYKPIQLVEIMMSLGYQNSSMKSSGHLVNKDNPLQQINPNLTVKGNNGFRFGIKVALQLGEKPRAFELGLLLALKMGQEIREKKPLGSTTAKMVAEWNRTYPSSLVEEAIASAKEFLMNPAKLAEKIKAGMKKIDEKRDDADKSDETESKDLSEGENG